jgi:hypothetical protein
LSSLWQLSPTINTTKIFPDDDEDLPEHELNPDYALVDDMILAPEQYDILYNNASRRTGLVQAVRLWPNATVPYILDNNFSKFQMNSIANVEIN